MKALSALSKFAGVYDTYKCLIKAYGLKWSVNNDDVIIARLLKNYNNNGNDLAEWIRTVKREIPVLSTFMDFIVATGLRLSEAIDSFNLIVRLTKQGKVAEYYNAERETLEHFRFREVFIRRTKKAFISFVSKELINKIGFSPLISRDIIVKRLQRLRLKSRFGDIREFYASYAVKHLRQPEIDFLQGRVSASVFMCNYFNPTWISDLKDRALKTASELLEFTR